MTQSLPVASNSRITQSLRVASERPSMPGSEALQEAETFVKDPRVVTIICKQHSDWFASVLQHVQKTFQLGDAALVRLQEQATFEASFVPADSTLAPTICYEHMHACGDNLDLVYDAIYLRIKLPDNSSGIFDNSVGPPPSGDGISEDFACLNGFPGLDNQTGSGFGIVARAWKWMPRRNAIDRGVEGLEPAEGIHAQVLHLSRQQTRISSILLGIEAAAPMKDDFFGCAHGVSAKSKDRSSFGKRKWRDFRRGGIKVPADLGGVQVLITHKMFEETIQNCAELKLCSPHQCSTGARERGLFQEILQATSPQATALLSEIQRFVSEKSLKSRDQR